MQDMGKELSRMRYFDGLFLNAEDYSLDQEFYLRLQRLHNRYLHTWGIVSGLKVVPVAGESMKVKVQEGVALNQVVLTDAATKKSESVSQEILIYEGHPDNPVDLSEYNANESIYIMVSYEEVMADRNNERGQGEEIHIWERGRISHSNQLPEEPSKYIVLARIVPRNDGSSTVIDSDCIFDYGIDAKRTPLRVYAGAAGKKLVTERLVMKAKSDDAMEDMAQNEESLASMPSIYTLQGGQILQVDAPVTYFTGDVHIAQDVTLMGELYMQSKDKSQSELRIMNSFVEVNSPDENGEFSGLKDGGLEVYRGDGGANDARIVWVENEQCFKAGLGNDLKKIAYGDGWDSLIAGGLADSLHKHGNLSGMNGGSLGFNDDGRLYSDSDLAIKDDKTIWLKAANRTTVDSRQGLAWFGKGKTFANAEVEGPVLFGSGGGVLGTRDLANGVQVDKAVVSWSSSGNVGIGPRKPLEDNLDVDGSLRILSGKNPLRFTSVWSAFPDDKINGAEICNDTSYHKALMLVGNQSAGQGRKVAVWDRLDVNGFLYVNGKMQASQEIIPSVGRGEHNGIIFPGDPGGGSGDLAWIKYFPRTGEDCTLEIGTSNDANDHISLNASGNVGISTLTPRDKLEVAGGLRILTGAGQNPVRFTSNWQGFPDQAPNQAEISNDNGVYKSLMIVGNTSAGGRRRVSVWDDLDVNGYLKVNGGALISGDLQINGTIKAAVLNFDGRFKKLDVADSFRADVRCADFCIGYSTRRGSPGRALVDNGSHLVLNYGNDWSYASVHSGLEVRGALTPSAGSGNNGIIFPSDPGGGWGDSAYIKYYPTSGENCVLDIGVTNDSGDRIYIHASGGVYANGMYWSSSREIKDNIADLSVKEAKQLLDGLNPVSFKYKESTKERTLGFVAEEVPAVLADPDQRAVGAMDIIAVLTSVLKDQQKALNRMQKQIAALQGA
jgi:hypothetical protein